MRMAGLLVHGEDFGMSLMAGSAVVDRRGRDARGDIELRSTR
jgi:hypothetical protein